MCYIASSYWRQASGSTKEPNSWKNITCRYMTKSWAWSDARGSTAEVLGDSAHANPRVRLYYSKHSQVGWSLESLTLGLLWLRANESWKSCTLTFITAFNYAKQNSPILNIFHMSKKVLRKRGIFQILKLRTSPWKGSVSGPSLAQS